MRAIPTLFGCLLLLAFSVSCSAAPEAGDQKKVLLSSAYTTKIGQKIHVTVSLSPASVKPTLISIDDTWISFPRTKYLLKAGEDLDLVGTTKVTTGGLAWVHVRAPDYEDGFLAIDAGFEGHLQLGKISRLPYDQPTAVVFTIVNGEGKPFPLPANLSLSITSADAELSWDQQKGHQLDIDLGAGVKLGPMILINPTNRTGGPVHLNCSLGVNDWSITLDQQAFTIEGEPATWIPIALAIAGGFIYGLYKIITLIPTWTDKPVINGLLTLLSASIAGFVGYLIADLDLLGLKLDTTLLRTFPLLGFIVAFAGVDAFIPKKGKGQPDQRLLEFGHDNERVG